MKRLANAETGGWGAVVNPTTGISVLSYFNVGKQRNHSVDALGYRTRAVSRVIDQPVFSGIREAPFNLPIAYSRARGERGTGRRDGGGGRGYLSGNFCTRPSGTPRRGCQIAFSRIRRTRRLVAQFPRLAVLNNSASRWASRTARFLGSPRLFK